MIKFIDLFAGPSLNASEYIGHLHATLGENNSRYQSP